MNNPTRIKVVSSIYLVGIPPIWLVIQLLYRRQGKVGEIPTTFLSVHYVVASFGSHMEKNVCFFNKLYKQPLTPSPALVL